MEDKTIHSCLIITPFSDQFRSIRQRIAEALHERGIEPILLEQQVKVGASFVETIHDAIEQVDFIIADLTESNPNVMYELGYAHGLGKPVLIIVQEEVSNVPSDLSGRLYLVYDRTKLNELAEQIQMWTRRLTFVAA
ncbi:MAG: TIR domain-containing protein [bacterium]